MAAFLQVGLALDLAAVAGLVGQAQDVQGLGDPPAMRDRVTERVGRPSHDGMRITSYARTAPMWMEPMIPQDVLPLALDPGRGRPGNPDVRVHVNVPNCVRTNVLSR
ncbi:hypothetical protein OG379_40205 (plasmid) [Streptomyces sp. NBC_01166]|nr:hypothetical protein OG379_40205 [Streptomyces sp. NBC_01166]